MDSQIPNKAAEEWIRKGGLFPEEVSIRPEKNMEIPDLTYMWNLRSAVRL